MQYQLKNDTIEAWRIGDENAPDWVADLIVEKGIVTSMQDSTHIVVTTDDGPVHALVGDYITYKPTVYGEPSEDAPQGELQQLRSVKVITRADFERVYDCPDLPPSTAAPALDEGALVAHDEAARPLTAAEIEAQPLAADPPADEAPTFEIEPTDLEPIETEKPKRRR